MERSSILLAILFLIICYSQTTAFNLYRSCSRKVCSMKPKLLLVRSRKSVANSGSRLHGSSSGLEMETVRQFEPVISAEVAYTMGGLTLLLTASAIVWWTQVVPTKRTELARSKAKGGEVRQYLDELQTAGESGDERGFERWLFSDWLKKDKSSKPGALPFLKKAKWNSGDNPVLVAFGAIMACVIAASLAERASSLVQ